MGKLGIGREMAYNIGVELTPCLPNSMYEPQSAKEDLCNYICFLKEFADKCHHGKEVKMLFPDLAKAGIPQKGGPIGVILSEHVHGRNLIKEMDARRYSSLLQNHIQKENNVLFPEVKYFK